jgi:hypothetical protein
MRSRLRWFLLLTTFVVHFTSEPRESHGFCHSNIPSLDREYFVRLPYQHCPQKNIPHNETLLETGDSLLLDARIEGKFDLYGPSRIVKDFLKVLSKRFRLRSYIHALNDVVLRRI